MRTIVKDNKLLITTKRKAIHFDLPDEVNLKREIP